MINAKRFRAAFVAIALAPLAACSSVPNPIAGIGNILNPPPEESVAPTDGRISILTFEQRLQVDPNVEQPAIVLPPAYVNSLWPQPGGYPTHALQHTAASGALEIAWSTNIGEGSSNDRRLNARPVVADGRVFMLDARGDVVAVEETNGNRVWTTRLEDENRNDRMAFGGGLSFDEGRIYAHSGGKFFVALDATTGTEIWRTTVLIPFHGAPTAVGGRIYVSSDDNELLALDAATGVVQWTYQGIVESARLLTSPSPAVLGDIVVAPFASGELVALRTQNGNPIWSDSLTRSGNSTALSAINDVAGSPVIIDGVVYAMSHSGVLVAVELRSGERLWTLPAGGLHTPWVVGDYLYVVTTEAEVVCVNRLTGTISWITSLDLFENPNRRKNRIAWSGPIMAGGRVFLASSTGDAAILNAYDGSMVREFNLNDDVFVAPVIANETIYVLTDEARLIALR